MRRNRSARDQCSRPHPMFPAALTALAALIGTALVAPTAAETPVTGIPIVPRLSGTPLYVTHAPRDTTRIFITTEAGVIWIVRLPSNSLVETPFLIVPHVVVGFETGLLGLAFHPDYVHNGYLYV